MYKFKILTNIQETDENLDNSKFFGSPVFPENFLENNNLENDFFFFMLNLNEYQNSLFPQNGFLYFFLNLDHNPCTPKVIYTTDELVEVYDNINEDFNMEDSNALFIEKCDESNNALFLEKESTVILLQIDLDFVPLSFPRFNKTSGKIVFEISKEALTKKDFSCVSLKFEK